MVKKHGPTLYDTQSQSHFKENAYPLAIIMTHHLIRVVSDQQIVKHWPETHGITMESYMDTAQLMSLVLIKSLG